MAFSAGAKCDFSLNEIAQLRRSLLQGELPTIRKMLELFEKYELFTKELLKELTRTPSMKQILQRDLSQSQWNIPEYRYANNVRSTSPGYWKKHWSQH
jgi:predicted DNA-binding protein YlxM (UPF0122 family)